MHLGAFPMLNVPFSSFRLSSGCRLELVLAITPTRINVAEVRARRCCNREPVAMYCFSIGGVLSATASERVDGNLGTRPILFG